MNFLVIKKKYSHAKLNTQITNCMKLRLVGDELFHADGLTNTTKLTVVFRNFANVSDCGWLSGWDTNLEKLSL